VFGGCTLGCVRQSARVRVRVFYINAFLK